MVAPFSYSYHNKSRNGVRANEGANSRLSMDNLIRRELRVSDPSNAQEVAAALLARYQGTPQAEAIDREAEGLPFLMTPTAPTPMVRAETSSDAELRQAMDDVERDLQELTHNAILKDVTPELEGWATAIRSMLTEGFNAARYALDSSQRDKTFGIRRTLGDYARMARFVGALSSPVVNVNFRNLAQSIDEVNAVLLVTMGEALANVSFNRSRYLLQVPYGELQARRDSTIYALRNLVGSTQQAYEPNEWPRGVDAYRQLYKYLEDQGQGDLRSLLVETELSRLMDTLIQRASHGNVEGLRQLGATAQLDIPRLRRLVIIASDMEAVSPQAPPLTAFIEALQLFIDAFESSGGFRLLRLARPPILFYGLYGSSRNEQTAEARLVQLSIARNRLAELLDCFLQCGCTPERVQCQVVLDKVLYDLDRAIDLYALGTAENIDPEFRAVAYSYITDVVLQGIPNNLCNWQPQTNEANPLVLTSRIRDTLEEVRSLLFQPLGEVPPGGLGPLIPTEPIDPSQPVSPISVPPPLTPEAVAKLVRQELLIQGDTERRWKDLIQTLAPTCVPFSRRDVAGAGSNTFGIFDIIEQVIESALRRASGQTQPFDLQLLLPAHYETSLTRIATDT